MLNKNTIKKLFYSLLIVVLTMSVMSLVAFATGEETAEYVSNYAGTIWSLLPPIVAIGLVLITKEVYSSLFAGILVGGLLYSNFNLETTMIHVFSDALYQA